MRNKRNTRKHQKKETINAIHIVLILLVFLFIFAFFKNLISGSANSKNSTTLENISNSISEENSENNSNKKDDSSKETEVENVLEEDIQFSMAVTGDIMCHNTNYLDAYDASTKSYDFSYYFTDIKRHLQGADVTVGNLETTLAGAKRGYSGYPTFNTPEILAKNLKKAGFNIVTTANNHCMDKGYSGIESTIDFLDEADLEHTGTFKSKEDQEKILVRNVKGVNIAFLSFTYGTNGISIPKDKSYSVNLIDKDLIKKQIKLAKEKNPDLICVSMHWGIEYQTSANKEQKNLADFLFENGVDVILGNHSHVPQEIEKRTVKLADGTKKNGFVIYSLGNFMANQNKPYTKDSAILNIKFTKHKEKGNITIDSVSYTPTYMFSNSSKNKKKFKILDIEQEIKLYEAKADNAVSTSTYNTLVKELKNIKKIIGTVKGPIEL